jgi:hypothetical protein
MACHEIAALRLGMMKVLGREDVAERQHELAELGDSVAQAGPLRSMTEAQDLGALRRWFEASLTDLHTRVANTPDDDEALPYLRALMVLTKKVELELGHQIDSLTRLYRDLDEMHDFVHEVYPVG